MLYVSTRNRTESYTAHRALHEITAPDGGMFVPFKLPHFTKDQIRQLGQRSVCENIAHILSQFYSFKISGRDVEFCIGRYPVQIIALPHKLFIAEVWHNLSGQYAQMELALYQRLSSIDALPVIPQWVKISIQCAFLFALYGCSPVAARTETLDIAVDDCGFISPMAAWYARAMGLPIGTIICGSRDGSDVWNLTRLGELNGDVDRHMAAGLEHYIYAAIDQQEAVKFADSVRECTTYTVDPERMEDISRGLFAAVVSKDRINTMVCNFYRTSAYILDSSAAIGISALQDFRSTTGANRSTLILSQENPVNASSLYQGILGISAAQIDQIVNHRKG